MTITAADFDDYITWAKTKMNGIDLTENALLGLSGEWGEIVEIHKKVKYHGATISELAYLLELGDFVFYIAMFIAGIKELLLVRPANMYDQQCILYSTALFNDQWLNLYGYTRGTHDSLDVLCALEMSLGIADYLSSHRLELVLALNQVKLNHRYPNGFSTEPHMKLIAYNDLLAGELTTRGYVLQDKLTF